VFLPYCTQDTGTIEANRPAVLPLACAIGSPSGAFLDLR